MKKDFTLEVFAENSFGILNRMINALNRRRIRIKSLTASELADNPHAGSAKFILHTTEETIQKVKLQIEKFIEVDHTVLHG
jgi:acetolactate synthase small subunit